MNFWKRLIPHEHKFIPIVYGLLTKAIDENGQIIEHPEFYEGGCVIKDEKFICSICGKTTKQEVNPEKEGFNYNWINIICFAIFIGVCAWLLFHDPCTMCRIDKITCKDIMQTYIDYKKNMSGYDASIAAGNAFFGNNISLANFTG
jgi:hypothetical protein